MTEQLPQHPQSVDPTSTWPTPIGETGTLTGERILPFQVGVAESAKQRDGRPSGYTEDHTVSRHDTGTFVVCDGAAGDHASLASETAANAISSTIATHLPYASLTDAETHMAVALDSAREALAELEVEEDGQPREFENEDGITTAVAVQIVEFDGKTYAVIGNVGDSGVMRYRPDGTVERLTTEQCDPKNRRKLANQIGAERLVNRGPFRAADNLANDEVFSVEIEPGHQLVVASDGIWGDNDEERLTGADISDCLKAETAEGAANALLQTSKKNDDKSCIVIRFGMNDQGAAVKTKEHTLVDWAAALKGNLGGAALDKTVHFTPDPEDTETPGADLDIQLPGGFKPSPEDQDVAQSLSYVAELAGADGRVIETVLSKGWYRGKSVDFPGGVRNGEQIVDERALVAELALADPIAAEALARTAGFTTVPSAEIGHIFTGEGLGLQQGQDDNLIPRSDLVQREWQVEPVVRPGASTKERAIVAMDARITPIIAGRKYGTPEQKAVDYPSDLITRRNDYAQAPVGQAQYEFYTGNTFPVMVGVSIDEVRRVMANTSAGSVLGDPDSNGLRIPSEQVEGDALTFIAVPKSEVERATTFLRRTGAPTTVVSIESIREAARSVRIHRGYKRP